MRTTCYFSILVVIIGGCSADGSFEETSTGDEHGPTNAETTEDRLPSYEGEHVVVFADPGLELCAGSIAHMDRFIAEMADRLAIETPVGDDRIRYTWVTGPERLVNYCQHGDVFPGCANEHAFAIYAPLDHELVHTLARRMVHAWPTSFFSEGLANAHEGYNGVPKPNFYLNGFLEDDLIDLVGLPAQELGPEGYEAAGRFTAHLIDRHGMTRYRELYVALTAAGSDVAAIDATFREVLGSGLADSISGFTDPSAQTVYDPLLAECNAPEIPWDGVALEMSGLVSCAGERAVGPYNGLAVVVHYTLDVPADGDYDLRLSDVAGEASVVPDDLAFQPFVGVAISSCVRGNLSYMATRVGGTPRLSRLYAGKNTLRLIATPDAPVELSFTLMRVD